MKDPGFGVALQAEGSFLPFSRYPVGTSSLVLGHRPKAIGGVNSRVSFTRLTILSPVTSP